MGAVALEEGKDLAVSFVVDATTRRQAMEAFADTDLFKGFVADPHITGITARDFAVLEGPTAVTHREAAIAA